MWHKTVNLLGALKRAFVLDRDLTTRLAVVTGYHNTFIGACPRQGECM